MARLVGVAAEPNSRVGRRAAGDTEKVRRMLSERGQANISVRVPNYAPLPLGGTSMPMTLAF